MKIDENYPVVLYGDGPPGAARLLTAVHIACIDGGEATFGLEFAEEELQDFYDTNYHRYFFVQPRGNLKIVIDRMLRAVRASIQNGELKLLVVRKNLSNDLLLENCWVLFDEFEAWCEIRSIELGETWFDFIKDDMNIATAAGEQMDEVRRRLEGLGNKEGVEELKEKLEAEGVDWLLNETASLRAKVKNLENKSVVKEDIPLSTRERTTLLTIIAVLCQDASMSYTKAAKTAAVIHDSASKMGLSIGESTIEGHLKKIPAALGGRMK